MKNFLLIMVLVGLGFSLTPGVAMAKLPSLVPEECQLDAPLTNCTDCEPTKTDRSGCCCNLSSLEMFLVNVAQIILGLTGSIALIMFVAGGIMLMISGGSPDKINKAKSLLQTAVIGLAIILLAGVIVKIVVKQISGF